MIVECSDLSEEQVTYLKNNVDIVLNLYQDLEIRQVVYGLAKAHGEGILTINAIQYLNNQGISNFDNFYKISGRYYLNDIFNYQIFDQNKYVFHQHRSTTLYKIPKDRLQTFLKYLINNIDRMKTYMCYEDIIHSFVPLIPINERIIIDQLGVTGNIAVDYSLIIT
jgi:hypothetical protein